MRRINIKQKLCSYITILAMMFQFFSFLPIFQVNAEENITEFTKFITNVSITDGNNNPISGPIKNNADVKLQYNFELPNEHNIKKDQSYIMHIPEEFEIINQINFSINDDSGEVIANGTIDIDGKVTIVFTEFVEQHSNISGYFFIETKFDEKVIGGNDKQEIEFDLGGSGNSKIIEVDFEQPEKPDASIHKKGSYDASTNEITWEIIVNPENVKIEKANIIDVISEGQEFVVGSVKINGQDANNNDYGYNSNERELTYTFPDTIETKQIITFKTKLASMGLESHGKTIVEKNQATFTHDDTTVVSNEATVVIKPDFIQKTGKYDEDTKTIKWTIKVNNSSQTITNAVVTDDIPQGLKFIDGSVKVDGKEDSNYNLKDQKFTYTFPGTIKEPHTIEFLTDVVDKDIYLSNEGKNFNNTATITDNGNGSASDGSEVRVYSSVISKRGKGYDPSTGEITWEIVVNRNKIDIENAVVSDDIIKGQEYVENSFKIYNYSTNGKEANGEISYKPSTSDDSTKTGTLMYEFKESISDIYIITFKTKVTDKNVYAGNANTVYSNKSKLTGKNIKDSESTAEQKVISQVINKSSIDYDYVKREITWEIVVNKNNMPLSNVSVIDVIKEGQEFVPNSVTINGAIDTSNYNYDEGSKTLKYTFDKDINKEQIITFKTKVTDTSIFNTNGEKVVENTSKLITNLVPGGVESTGTGKIKNTLVKKEGKYTKGNSYIDWDVTINSNKISMKDVVLEDVLQEGLELDTTSVKLYKQNQNSDGSLTKGEEVELGGNNVKYDMKTRKFTFTLTSPTVDAYILAFRTNVVDKTKSPFSNSISFKGTGLTESSTSNGIDVIYQGAGGGGIGETGSIKVIKVNNDNESIKLKGAIFELLDKYKNVIKTSEPTGNNGDVVFKNLKFGIDYYIKEKTAPEGYLLSDEVYKFQIANSKESKSITYNYKNISVKGDIIFNKLNENEKPLRGAEFTLYKASDISFENPIDTSISDKNGDVKFKDIDYGEYVIKETKAPTGYTINEKILKATINENGKVVTANPDSVSNTKIRGSIEFTKLGEDNEPLKGAEFKLYKASDKNYENEIATAKSDDAGKVVFENIEYGDYAIKETKAPEGYELTNKILKASITSNGKTIKANPESISNTKTKGSIEFTKLGEYKERLKGAEFKLYKKSDTEFKNPISTAVSDRDGLVKFNNVEYGEYVIKESKAPEGYVQLSDDKVLKATVNENRKSVKADPDSVSNTKIRGSIEFTKLGEDNEPLKGAEFKLYKASDKNFEGEIATAESDDAGKVVFENIEYGNYVIKETKAPEGYELTNKVLKASIVSNGKLIKAN
ncbi:SpaA isopeptide-forming pilin-related protein, partial [Metaclostridioides mangenotii]|uniref:SpaA isopeptide-forming pilin-related protein n=1 Tax=Metaclostridioides mangenotii TaxID=1540 RepID=UPI0026EC7E64